MFLPKINLFESKYYVFRYREVSFEELKENQNLIQKGLQVEAGIKNVLFSSEDVVRYIADEQGDNKYENYLIDLLSSSPNFKIWENTFSVPINSELDNYQNKYTNNYTRLDKEIKKYNRFLDVGQRIFRGSFGSIAQYSYNYSTPISTTLFPTVAYAEIVRNAKKNQDMVIFDLTVDQSKTNVFFYDSITGVHSNEKEVLFASGAQIYVVGEYKKISEIMTCYGVKSLYYAKGTIY